MCKLYINNYTQFTNLFSTCVQHMDIFFRRGETNQPHGLSGRLDSFRLSRAGQVQANYTQSKQLTKPCNLRCSSLCKHPYAQHCASITLLITVQASLWCTLCKHPYAQHCARITMLSTSHIAYSKQCKHHYAHHCVSTTLLKAMQASPCSSLCRHHDIHQCASTTKLSTSHIA